MCRGQPPLKLPRVEAEDSIAIKINVTAVSSLVVEGISVEALRAYNGARQALINSGAYPDPGFN